MARCPQCGRNNPDTARACAACGKPLRSPSPTAGVRPRVALRVVRADGGPEASAVMTGDSLTCGQRGDLALADDPFLAPIQVRFFFLGGALTAEDIGGGNGTFQRIKGEVVLGAGSELRIGRQRLVLEPLGPPVAAADGAIPWGSPDAGATLRLVQYLEGGVHGRAFLLVPGAYGIGRDSGDFTFPQDGFISRRHAVIQVDPARVSVRDVGSSNGTFVRMTREVPVENGDQFFVGRELVRVEIVR